MRNGDDSFAFHELVQTFLNSGFHFTIQRAGGLVQQQNGRVFEHDAGNGNALALPARKFHAALAHLGVVARVGFGIHQASNEVVCLCLACGLHHFDLAGFGAAIEDVFANGAVQQGGVLRHHADGAAQAVLRNMANVLPVDADATLLPIIEPQQQAGKGGFARARRADQSQLLAGTQAQVQVLNRPFSGRLCLLGICAARVVLLRLTVFFFIGERDVFKHHLTLADNQRLGIGRIQHLVVAAEHIQPVAHGADLLEQARAFPHDPVRHAIQAQCHGAGSGHCADRDLPLAPQPDGQCRGAADQAHGQYVVAGVDACDQPHLPMYRVHEVLHRLFGVLGFAPRMRKEFDGVDIGVGIGDAPRHE